MQLTSSFLSLAIALTTVVNGASIQQVKPLLRRDSPSFQKPVLGYNTYNAYACSPNEQDAKNQIDALQNDGYLAAGYTMFQVDCGWQADSTQRNSSAGNAIQQNLQAFPSGLQALGQYAIQRGFYYGLYSDAGYRACDTVEPSPQLGSLGYEDQDAAQFASWDVSYVKYDSCYASGTSSADNAPKNARTDFITRYSPMTNALRSRGIEGGLTCQWGVPYQDPSGNLEGPVSWTGNISTSFRISDDINDTWDSVVRIMNQAINLADKGLTGPGHHGDMDLLEVGNGGLSFAEQQSHFAFWAMSKSALVISTDLTQASSQTHDILTNSGLIDINQDDSGIPISLVERYTGDHDLYSGALSNGDLAVLLVNMQNNSESFTINFSDLNITSANLVDLYTGTTQTSVSSYTATIDGHAPIALRLSNIVQSDQQPPSVQWIDATSGTLAGNANVQDCNGCPNGQKVGDLGNGNGNTVTFTNLDISSETATILFDYINCEIAYLGQGSNVRTASISVNGQSPVNVDFPISGYNWDSDILQDYRVQLSGFTPGNSNSIQIGNPSAYAPDMSRIGIVA